MYLGLPKKCFLDAIDDENRQREEKRREDEVFQLILKLGFWVLICLSLKTLEWGFSIEGDEIIFIEEMW